MPIPSKHLLITGGMGYVGGRISTHLASAAPDISIRLMSRRQPDQAPDWAKDMDLFSADVLNTESLQPALDGIDTVIHLAAPNEIESARDPEAALDVNGKGTYRLLEACREQGVKRFIYFSTFHVYGPEAPQPITETTPTTPIHPYSLSHHVAEDIVNWYHHSFGMETAILRLSNAYGYPADPLVQRWTLVFNDLCRQAVVDGKIQLRSKGTQQRDFIPLSDVARSVQHLIGLPPGSWGKGLFNLGGECSMSIHDVAQRVAKEYADCYDKEVPVITGEAEDAQETGPVVFKIDSLKETGFTLAGSLSDEVGQTFELCRQMEAKG
jgi:UDP-glucose 4-epimerase